jgi:hypothetical protein
MNHYGLEYEYPFYSYIQEDQQTGFHVRPEALTNPRSLSGFVKNTTAPTAFESYPINAGVL